MTKNNSNDDIGTFAEEQRQSQRELNERIDDLLRQEKHLEAARLLRSMNDPSMISDMHRRLLSKVGIIEYVFFSFE
jgi:hypothetical protein